MNIEKLSAILQLEPKYRFTQVNKALWQDHISSWQEASALPQKLREELENNCPLEIKAELEENGGRNKSVKALIVLEDGEKIETVLIRQDKKRNTVCLSSQVGCPLACEFCATGHFGFRRNLSSNEMIEQLVFWQRYLKAEKKDEKVDNIVFMGMGEPFLNYPEFIKTVKFFNNPETLNIGSRRISVSTAGIIEGIKRLSGEKLQINLAISLHAASDEKRRDLMPIALKYSLYDLFRAVDNYITKTGRRVMFEYLMLKGVNDSDQDALELAKLMAKPLYMLNLIPYNPTGRFQASSRERIDKFKKILEDKNIPVTVRLSFGGEIKAACGQLRGSK